MTDLTRQKTYYAENIANKEMLDHLKKSETIRMVIEGKYSPQDVDNAFRNMKKKIGELEHLRQMDMAEVVGLRRQIELLVRSDER